MEIKFEARPEQQRASGLLNGSYGHLFADGACVVSSMHDQLFQENEARPLKVLKRMRLAMLETLECENVAGEPS